MQNQERARRNVPNEGKDGVASESMKTTVGLCGGTSRVEIFSHPVSFIPFDLSNTAQYFQCPVASISRPMERWRRRGRQSACLAQLRLCRSKSRFGVDCCRDDLPHGNKATTAAPGK